VLLFVFFTNKNKQGNNGFNSNDVVFVLDISKSMLATDVLPSRLEQAKKLIAKVVAKNNVNRVALITFSKLPNMQVPLTANKTTMLDALNNINANAIQSTSNINPALNLAIGIINVYEAANQHVLILSDGEMQQPIKESLGDDFANNKINLNACVLGTSNGANIIDNNVNDFVKDAQGKVVVSKAQFSSFNNLVALANGSSFNFDNFNEYINSLNNSSSIKKDIKGTYYGLLYLALGFLIIPLVINLLNKNKSILAMFIALFFMSSSNLLGQSKINLTALENAITQQKFEDAQLIIKKSYHGNLLMKEMYTSVLHQRFNKHEAAIKLINNCLHITNGKQLATIKYNKAIAYLNIKNYDSVINICQKLLMLNSNNNDARVLLQKALQQKNNKDKKQENPLPKNIQNLIGTLQKNEDRIKKIKNNTYGSKYENNW
jgi:Ca-activated chloride channel homolog